MNVMSPFLFLNNLYAHRAEPLKKRRKMDVNIILQREQKKRRRLEKAIRRLQNKGLKLKPVEEIEGDRQVLKTLE